MTKGFLIATLLLLIAGARAQTCDAPNAQSAWKMRADTQSGARAAALRPVRDELMRLFPAPPKGVEPTYGIFDASGTGGGGGAGADYYEGFVMIKKLVCERRAGAAAPPTLLPEGETGCWIYFRVNDFGKMLENYGSPTSIKLPGTETPLVLAGDVRLVDAPNGMKGVYFFDERGAQKLAGWYFSALRRPPFRALSRAELGAAYRAYWTAKLDGDIARLGRELETSRRSEARVRSDASMTAADKESFFRSLRESDARTREAIARFESQRADVARVTDAMMRAPDANATAVVANLNDLIYEPASLRASSNGFRVFVEDESVLDARQPGARPQYVTVAVRRQDETPGKTAFIDRFEREFDFNVVRRLVGADALAAAPTIDGVGNRAITRAVSPDETRGAASGELYADDFASAPSGPAVPGWTLSGAGAGIRQTPDGKRLDLRAPGLYYPNFAVAALPPSFEIEFEVSWPKEISYYSHDFVFHLGAANYDNALRAYDRAQVAPNAYTAARMPRLALWIDPHWNGAGRWGLDLFDARGGYVYRKSDKTDIWFKDKNRIRVRIQRKGAALGVYFNDKLVVSEPSIMTETVRWNFFGFGLTEAPNASPDDHFELGNVRVAN